jgi:hypothetical protein
MQAKNNLRIENTATFILYFSPFWLRLGFPPLPCPWGFKCTFQYVERGVEFNSDFKLFTILLYYFILVLPVNDRARDMYSSYANIWICKDLTVFQSKYLWFDRVQTYKLYSKIVQMSSKSRNKLIQTVD